MAEALTFKQTPAKRLAIHTALDRPEDDVDFDPLVLVYVKGTEEISQPYSYGVKMWRLIDDVTRTPLTPGDMINTRVRIHINITQTMLEGILVPNQTGVSKDAVGEPIHSQVRRCGVFETFNDEGTILGRREPVKIKGQEFRLRQYSATIVPAFKIMNYETTYRVFENKDVVQIIREATEGFSNFRLDSDRLQGFPKIPYCVQYNESTFNFVSRLMARFGIWYFFDHELEANNRFSVMVLGTGEGQFKQVEIKGLLKDHPAHQLAEISNKDLAPSALTIKTFNRVYAPVERRARFGNFNILDPTDPITAAFNVEPKRDLIEPPQTRHRTKAAGRREPDDDDRFRVESFAAPVDQNGRDDSPEAPSAQAHATKWMQGRDVLTTRVTGSTKNPGLIPGLTFDRINRRVTDKEEQEIAAEAGADIVVFQNIGSPSAPVSVIGTYVVLRVEFEGVEASYAEGKDFITVLREIIFPSNLNGTDFLADRTADGLNNYLQDAIAFTTRPVGDTPYFFPLVLGGGLGAVTGLIPVIVKAIADAFKDEKPGDFHCSFAAVPLQLLDYQGDGVVGGAEIARFKSLPLPAGWVKPIASGPHLAVVIGPDGTILRSGSKPHHADALGRVRVRFPWDRKKGEQPGDSFKRGDNACWVRVAEAWAGQQYGTQFLPRIGQEVIVDFLDGDPDRPIITGRVYNADKGFANIPFPEGQVDVELVEPRDVTHAIGFNDYRFTGIKTSSIPDQGAQAKPRFHLTRFDDTLNCEQYLIRSQGRLDVTAFAHSFETTQGNKHVRVVPGKDKDGKTFGGSEFITVGGEYDLHIGGARYEGVDKAYHSIVKADTIFDLQTAHHTMVGTESTLNAKTIVIEAPIKITLKVGSSFIVLDPAGVWIQGPVVMINSGGVPGVTTDVEVIDPADAEAAEPGDQWNKRLTTCDPHPKAGGGGGRRGRTVKAKHGLAVTFNPADQSFNVGRGIRVSGGTPAYRDAVITDLATMDQTPAGHTLINSLNTSGRTTTITPLTPPASPANAFATATNAAAASVPGTPGTVDAAGNPIAGAGTGSDSTLNYNPSDWPDPTYRTKPPGDIVLFHELKHADHNAHGTRDVTPRADNFDDQEEFNTIQDENQYRDQRGHPRRNDHHDL
jgi:uncharacterized protein involved in type VI secretion and phage assembly